MNYLKDRYSYITVKGKPAVIKHTQHTNIFSQANVVKQYSCWCGETFEYYQDIHKHRIIHKHFKDKPKELIRTY